MDSSSSSSSTQDIRRYLHPHSRMPPYKKRSRSRSRSRAPVKRAKVNSRRPGTGKTTWTKATYAKRKGKKRFTRRKKPSRILSSLAAVSPVKLIQISSLTTLNANNNVANQQNVMQPLIIASSADLANVMGMHGLTSAVLQNNQKCYLLSAKAEVKITNFDVGDMHFKVYLCKNKYGATPAAAPQGPVPAWVADDAVIEDGGTTLVPAVDAGQDNYLTYGADITRCSGVTATYRVKKIMEFDCSTNGTKTFTLNTVKKPYPLQVNMTDAAVGVSITRFLVVIGYTQPMCSFGNNVTAVTSGKFGVMSTETYISKMIPYSGAVTALVNSITGPTGVMQFAGDATDSIINDAHAGL